MSVSLSSIAIPCTITNLRPSYPMEMHSTRFLRVPLAAKTSLLRLCFTNSSHTSMTESSDFDTSSVENEKQGPTGKGGFFQTISFNEMLTKLKRYGISGILSYGLLNTAYYSVTFLVVWLYVAPAPGRMGYLAAVERFLKVMAMVWAGSQVTKLIRVGGALALAPFVDRGLSWFSMKFGFKSQEKVTILQAPRASYSNGTHNTRITPSTSQKVIGAVFFKFRVAAILTQNPIARGDHWNGIRKGTPIPRSEAEAAGACGGRHTVGVANDDGGLRFGGSWWPLLSSF